MFSEIKRRPSGTLGILTARSEDSPPFSNRLFYKRLQKAGERIGIPVFVFTAQDAAGSPALFTGYTWSETNQAWRQQRMSPPGFVYDRCFSRNKKQYREYCLAVKQLQQRGTVFLGWGLKGKWHTAQILLRDKKLAAHIPAAQKLHSLNVLQAWLKQHRKAVIKPQNGSQGKGVLFIQCEDSAGACSDTSSSRSIIVQGRSLRNEQITRSFKSEAALYSWLKQMMGTRPCLIQQYLALHDERGSAFDLRSLMQKDGKGRWVMTGAAVREAAPGSFTANLHGGGSAAQADSYLERQFGKEQAAELMQTVQELSARIPSILEQYHGRLVELGIDFGIDSLGRIWILEVNSKPGRSIFSRINDDHARQAALVNPVRYARFLSRCASSTKAGEPR